MGDVTTATIATTQKKTLQHLSVHQWIRSAIHASQQLTSPLVSYPWNFRHRLVRYYWYIYIRIYVYIYIILLIMSHKACTGVYTCSILRQPRCWPSPDTNRTDFAEPRLNHERVAAACSWINLSASASASLQKVHREELPQNCPGMSNLAFYVFLSMLQIEHQL